MKVYNSYSSVMFTPWKLRRVVKELAARLPELMEEHRFDTIAVTGKSGLAVAFALSMLTDIKVVAVRKGESSHGDMIEGPDGHSFTRYAFFDDFVASGSTKARVHAELTNYAANRFGHEDAPQCVLCIEYGKNRRVSGYEGWCGDVPRYQTADPEYLEQCGIEFTEEL